MDERKINEALREQVIEQAQEKVKMTYWNYEFLNELNNVLTDHFKREQSNQQLYKII